MAIGHRQVPVHPRNRPRGNFETSKRNGIDLPRKIINLLKIRVSGNSQTEQNISQTEQLLIFSEISAQNHTLQGCDEAHRD